MGRGGNQPLQLSGAAPARGSSSSSKMSAKMLAVLTEIEEDEQRSRVVADENGLHSQVNNGSGWTHITIGKMITRDPIFA